MRSLYRAALGLALLAAPAFSQLNTTVGPNPVPLGGKLVTTFSNDNPGKFGVTTSLWRVKDASGTIIYVPSAPQVAILMGPGGLYSFEWPLTTSGGAPVAPGTYTLEVKADTGAPIQTFAIDVTASGAGIVLKGTATTQPVFGGGPARSFYLTAPADAGLPYFVLASTDLAGTVPTCGGDFPLGLSPLLQHSLTPNYVIQQSLGFLDANGESQAPSLPIPNNPAFVGIELGAAFVVYDPSLPCPFRRISNAHAMKVL